MHSWAEILLAHPLAVAAELLRQLEAVDASGLSPRVAFERELALQHLVDGLEGGGVQPVLDPHIGEGHGAEGRALGVGRRRRVHPRRRQPLPARHRPGVSALAGAVASNLAWDSALDARRTMVLLYRDQAVQVAVGSEGWVRTILRDDLAGSTNDHLDEIWATEIPALPIDSEAVQGQIWGSIEDLQGRFNINNLVDAQGEVDQPSLEQFQRRDLLLGHRRLGPEQHRES